MSQQVKNYLMVVGWRGLVQLTLIVLLEKSLAPGATLKVTITKERTHG